MRSHLIRSSHTKIAVRLRPRIHNPIENAGAAHKTRGYIKLNSDDEWLWSKIISMRRVKISVKDGNPTSVFDGLRQRA